MSIDVTDPTYGATGDGSTDDTAAIQSAFDAAEAARISSAGGVGPKVVFPAGEYVITSGLTQKRHSIEAPDGPMATRIIWNGAATGTAITRTLECRVHIKGLRFDPGTANPACWVDWSAEPIDWGNTFEDVFFGQIDDTNGTAAVRLGQIVNAHMQRVRFQGGPWAVEINHPAAGTVHRPFVMRDFTADFSSSSATQGLVRVVMAGAGEVSVRLENARIETTTAMVAPACLVKVESNPANTLAKIPVRLLAENLGVQFTNQTEDVSLLYQETTQTFIESSVMALSCDFKDGIDKIAGGTWSDVAAAAAPIPDGITQMLAFTRTDPGAANRNSIQLGRFPNEFLVSR